MSTIYIAEAYPGPCQTSTMERFTKIVNDFKSLARTPENIEAEELSENS